MPELHLYDVLRRPVVTEKSNAMSDLNQYVFEVALNATKAQIHEAVEIIFNVKVKYVNTMVQPPKRARRGRVWYWRTTTWKKAIVTLEPGNSISLFDV